ncbi:MAG: hypothetical protein ACK5AZ_19405 [Bryobacteraceae bacterium]
MKVRFLPLSPDLVEGCREFNQRLATNARPPFTLPDTYLPARQEGSVHTSQWLAVDEAGVVRGGFLLKEQQGWLNGQTVPLLTVQSPLFEGFFDRRFSAIALYMLRFLHELSPYIYAVGMGSEQNPFARFLAGAQWQLQRVPFFLSIVRSQAVLRRLPLPQSGLLRAAARFAAITGLGAAANSLWNGFHGFGRAAQYRLDPAPDWGDWTDAIWESSRQHIRFACCRGTAGLQGLYPAAENRVLRFVLRRPDGRIVGWTTCLLTQMEDSPHFGSLRVATMLDGLSDPTVLPTMVQRSRQRLAEMGADLIVANHSHPTWREALRRSGFLPAPSNYLLALSRPLSKALQLAHGIENAIHVTRGDGDGMIHL